MKTEHLNRITIFKDLTVDQVTNDTNMLIFSNLLDKYYDQFINFCESIKGDDTIKDIACFIENGQLSFQINR